MHKLVQDKKKQKCIDFKAITFAGRFLSNLIFVALSLWALFVPIHGPSATVLDNYMLKIWETDAGLVQNSVIAIAQTPDGYLWLGTYAGLSQFDGATFRTISYGSQHPDNNQMVTKLYVDQKGRLWASCWGEKIGCLQEGKWRFYGLSEGWNPAIVFSFLESNDGHFIICSETEIFTLDGDRIVRFPMPHPPGEKETIHCCRDNRGRLWCIQGNFFGYFDDNAWKPVKTSVSFKNGLNRISPSRDGGLWITDSTAIWKINGDQATLIPHNFRTPMVISEIYEDNEGRLWIFGDLGLVMREHNGRWNVFSNEENLVKQKFRAVYHDTDGNIWAGMDGGGLLRIKPRTVKVYSEKDGLTQNIVDSVIEHSSGRLLVATYGGGLCWLDENRFVPADEYGAAGTAVMTVMEDHQGALWVSGYHQGLTIYPRNAPFQHIQAPFKKNVIRILYQDSKKNVWIGTQKGLSSFANGKLTSYETNAGLHAAIICAIAEDRSGELWVGGDGGLFHKGTNQFKKFVAAGNQTIDRVMSLHVDKDNVLWIGTHHQGLGRLKNGVFSLIGASAGLSPKWMVSGIVSDDLGFLWLATDLNGIMRADRKNLQEYAEGKTNEVPWLILDKTNGMLSRECRNAMQPTVCKGRDGVLWFATLKGLAMVNPKTIRLNQNPPPVFISAISIDQRQIATDLSPLKAPAGAKSIRFDYTGVNVSDPEKTRFRHRLRGWNEEWHIAEKERFAEFVGLKPGPYLFEVQAQNNNGAWSHQGATLSFQILPFFWQTYWFQGSFILILLGGAAGIVSKIHQNRIRRSEELFEQQKALATERARSAALTQYASDIIILVSEEGRIVYESPSVSRILGYPEGHFIGKDPFHIIHPEDQLSAKKDFLKAEMHQNEGIPIAYRCRHQSGKWIYLESLSTNLLEHPGVNGILINSRNITERKQAEESKTKLEAQLRQAQKMESLGTLAGGIAHDFNNILSAIMGYAEIARGDAADRPNILESLKQIAQAGYRAKNLVKQILAFSRQNPQERRPISFQAVVSECLKLIRSSLSSTIEITSNIQQTPLIIYADPTQIHQVMMNLCSNAAHAMRNKPGQLMISLSELLVDESFASIHHGCKIGRHACLIVTDAGHGMSEETLKRIYDPFFTTKEPGEGTGLGLSVVDGIVKDLNGIISVESQLGVGTTFQILIPIHNTASILEKNPPLNAPQGHGEHILYVDDESVLCQSSEELLKRWGYRITPINQPAEALTQFKSNPDTFQLVITDLNMPGMTGIDLAIEIKKIRPQLPIILTSGIISSNTMELAKNAGISEMLMKPVLPETLSEVINRILHPGADNLKSGQ